LDEIGDDNIKDKWVYFIKNVGKLDIISDKLREIPDIEKAF
jgi:hypothetical protein